MAMIGYRWHKNLKILKFNGFVYAPSKQGSSCRCFPSCTLNTEAKPSFATHSDLFVKIKDKVYVSKILRDIWFELWSDELSAHSEILYQLSIKKLSEKVELGRVLITVSSTRKADMSIMSLQILHSAAQWLKNLPITQKPTILAVPKNATCKKIRALKVANVSQQDVKTSSNISNLTCHSSGLVTFDWNIEKKLPQTRWNKS